MAVERTDPTSFPPASEGSANRRRFLQALGAATVYVPPALVALLGDSRPAYAQNTGPLPQSSDSSESSAVIASAGDDQTVNVHTNVSLNGGDSTTTLGEELIYAWSFESVPPDSEATLMDDTAVSASFVADVPGEYKVRLTVKVQTSSESSGETAFIEHFDVVTISTINSAPVACAGMAQTVHPVATVQLDGTGSFDDDGHDLAFRWTLATPVGSAATLTDAFAASPSFEADVLGTYTATLTVNDGYVDSDPDSVIISTSNSMPVANAGTSLSTPVGTMVTLDGTNSSDADDDGLTYSWSFLSLPDGSLASLAHPHTAAPSFTADVAGIYVVGLIVNDGYAASTQSTVQVLAFVNQSVVVYEVQELQQSIGALDTTDFKNRNMQNALLNKLNAVIKKVSAGDYADALAQLQDDVSGKVNGANWLVNSGSQAAVYQQVQGIIAHLQTLV